MTSESRDIVERLRATSMQEFNGHPTLQDFAADELERLIEENESLRQACRAMAREIERMKGDLEARFGTRDPDLRGEIVL